VLWREFVCGCERTCGNLVMTFPIKKRISIYITELFVDRMAAIYIGLGLVIGPGQNFLTRVWSGQPSLV